MTDVRSVAWGKLQVWRFKFDDLKTLILTVILVPPYLSLLQLISLCFWRNLPQLKPQTPRVPV